jgi:hypothetical protein
MPGIPPERCWETSALAAGEEGEGSAAAAPAAAAAARVDGGVQELPHGTPTPPQVPGYGSLQCRPTTKPPRRASAKDCLVVLGVECFIMAAVMRELDEDEASTIRDFARRPPCTLPDDGAIEAVLPIVLTERNLSATRYDQHHPSTWSPADGVAGLAKESCQRNLGMGGLEPAQDDEGFYLRPQWSPSGPTVAVEPPVDPPSQ